MRDADEIRAEIDEALRDIDHLERNIKYKSWGRLFMAVFSLLRQLAQLLSEVVMQLETRGTE